MQPISPIGRTSALAPRRTIRLRRTAKADFRPFGAVRAAGPPGGETWARLARTAGRSSVRGHHHRSPAESIAWPFRACQPIRGGAVREGDRALGGHAGRRRSAGRSYRQAHRSLAQGQVHRRRAGQPRWRVVGRLQPADLGRALRGAASTLHRPRQQPRGLRPGLLRWCRSQATAARRASTPRRPGRASSATTCSSGRHRPTWSASSPTSRSSMRRLSAPTRSATASAARRSSWFTWRARRS